MKNTIASTKLLVGRRFDDPDVQQELARAPFDAVKLPSGGVGISVTYNDEPMVVSAEHFMAMMLTKAKEIAASANAGVNIADAVLAVPHWFTEAQRRGMLLACEIANINCLKVMNESTAVALSYGIFKSAKKMFSETDPFHVMFVDIGYSGYCVSIVGFIQENMTVKATVCDRTVSGRALDDIIVEYLAEVFQKKTGIDVRKNKKAVLKLVAAAEKAKKTLSPAGVSETNVSVECLAEDIDLGCILTKEELEKRAAHLISRLALPIEQALKEAGLTKEQLNEIEVVGGTTRVNVVKKTLGEILGLDASALNYGLKTTMNADEAVARGAALQCAMLSVRMRVKPFNIVDKLTHGITVQFDDASPVASEGDDAAAVKGNKAVLYVRGGEHPPKARKMTFPAKAGDFKMTACYDDESATHLPAGENKLICKVTIKVPKEVMPDGDKKCDMRVTWNLDKNGFLVVQSAQLFVEVPHTQEEIDNANKAAAEAAAKEGKAPEPVQMKKKYKKTDLEVVIDRLGLTDAEMKAAAELEASMAFEDKMIKETADKRNELEAYIYAMRDKIDGALNSYCTETERTNLKTRLTDSEDWLYNEGFDSTKQEYIRQLDDLRAAGNIVERRYNETLNRPTAIESLKKQIEMCKSFAAKYDDAHTHITEEERDTIRKETTATEEWMYDSISKQGDLPGHADPVLTVDIINGKRNALFQVANPIMRKPKPAPAPTTPAESKENTSESKDADGKQAESKDDVPMDESTGGPETDKDSKK